MSEKAGSGATGATGAGTRVLRLLMLLSTWLAGQTLAGNVDPRVRTVLYSADEVYRLPARIGYQIELEFQPGEVVLGLGTGDSEALSFKAQANHLFIKPKAGNVHTNVTVLTDRRVYRFDYVTLLPDVTIDQIDTVYALRFVYPIVPGAPSAVTASGVGARTSAQTLLESSSVLRRRNTDYWYCGAPQLSPISTWDDGVHTHLQFAANAELPAIFVINEDGSESLVNFNIANDEMVVHRVARRFVLRRGKLLGCVLNRGFSGSGDRLTTKTVSSLVERKLRGTADEAGP